MLSFGRFQEVEIIFGDTRGDHVIKLVTASCLFWLYEVICEVKL